MKKAIQLRKLRGKYNLAVKTNASTFKMLFTSPVFKLSDLPALIKGSKANRALVDFLGKFDLNAEPAEYKVPIYYILGENDWQTPSVLAQEYFLRINAPSKKISILPHAGHMTMVDQPALFLNILAEIKNITLPFVA